MTPIKKLLYEELTQLEVKQIVAEERVPLLPVGSIEAHGPHAPMKVDCIGPEQVCRLAAERTNYSSIVMPTVYYAYEGFNTNFPGTIHVSEPHIIGYVADILFSLAHHGFKKIIVINGHGGNVPFLNLAMRRLNAKTYPDTVACVISWWDLIPQQDLNRLAESEWGGMSHAGELETSVALYTDPDLIQMDKAVKELGQHDYRTGAESGMPASGGGTALGVAAYVGWMGGMGGNEHGVMGDATVATAEKGKEWLDVAGDSLADFIKMWKAKEIKPVADHH